MKPQTFFSKLQRDPLALIALTLLGFYALLSLLAFTGVIAGDFATVDNTSAHLPPSPQHWFGTDIFGRDVGARAIHATLTALSVGFIASLLSLAIGGILGAIAGYRGGWVDTFIVWLYTTVDSIPSILLMAAFIFALGQGLMNVYLALGLTTWVSSCRLIRGEFIKHRNRDYVTAARALGIKPPAIVFRHILPNVFHILIIQFGLGFVNAVKIEVILSYLGLGVEPGTPSWGLMIDDAKQELARGIWWNLAAATLFMFGLVLAVNLLTESLRRALDLKMKTI